MCLTFTHLIESRRCSVMFNAKPDERIRGILKANGFRWSPVGGFWWRQRVEGFADFLAGLDRAINPGRPDGACWACGEPGFFRPKGAATPVYCEACHAEHKRKDVRATTGTAMDRPTPPESLRSAIDPETAAFFAPPVEQRTLFQEGVVKEGWIDALPEAPAKPLYSPNEAPPVVAHCPRWMAEAFQMEHLEASGLLIIHDENNPVE
jgi:hypothetical protein